MVVRFSTVLVSTETCSYLFLLITLESGLRIVDDIFRGIRVTVSGRVEMELFGICSLEEYEES